MRNDVKYEFGRLFCTRFALVSKVHDPKGGANILIKKCVKVKIKQSENLKIRGKKHVRVGARD